MRRRLQSFAAAARRRRRRVLSVVAVTTSDGHRKLARAQIRVTSQAHHFHYLDSTRLAST